MDKVTLLPCPNPWCGSHDDDAVPEGEDIWQHPALSPVYRVQCPYCPVKGPTASTEQQAIIAWNTRATPAPDSEKLREAAKRVQRRVGEWDALSEFASGGKFAATGEQLRHDAMTLVTAALGASL